MKKSKEEQAAIDFLGRVDEEYRTIETQNQENIYKKSWNKFLRICDVILYKQEPSYFKYKNPHLTTGSNPDAVKVLYCYDGDTFVGIQNGGERVFRLASVDTPEKGKIWAKEAKRVLERLVDHKIVYVTTFGKDKYGRDVADCFLDDKKKISVNNILIKEGLSEYKDYSGLNTFKTHNFFQVAHKNLIFLRALYLKNGRWADKREEMSVRKQKRF